MGNDNGSVPVFMSKEYWLIIYLVAMGYKILNIECKQDDRGQEYLLWSFPPEAAAVEQCYIRNEEMPVDLQKVKAAAEVFKRNLQYYRIR